MSDSKLNLIKELVDSAQASLRSAKQLLDEITPKLERAGAKLSAPSNSSDDDEGKIIEGAWNGQSMVDKDGTEYPVPANYASKSKLVPGDILKLTIKEDGTFLYKQISPIARKRIVGNLTYEDGQYKVIVNKKTYNVLLASVTYFKGEVGDKVTIVVPLDEDSEWAAIENVIPEGE